MHVPFATKMTKFVAHSNATFTYQLVWRQGKLPYGFACCDAAELLELLAQPTEVSNCFYASLGCCLLYICTKVAYLANQQSSSRTFGISIRCQIRPHHADLHHVLAVRLAAGVPGHSSIHSYQVLKASLSAAYRLANGIDYLNFTCVQVPNKLRDFLGQQRWGLDHNFQ